MADRTGATFHIDLEKAAAGGASGPTTGASLDKPSGWPSSSLGSPSLSGPVERKGVLGRIAATLRRWTLQIAPSTYGGTVDALETTQHSDTIEVELLQPPIPLVDGSDPDEVDVVVVDSDASVHPPAPPILAPVESVSPSDRSVRLQTHSTSDRSVRLQTHSTSDGRLAFRRVKASIRAFFCPRFESCDEEENLCVSPGARCR